MALTTLEQTESFFEIGRTSSLFCDSVDAVDCDALLSPSHSINFAATVLAPKLLELGEATNFLRTLF